MVSLNGPALGSISFWIFWELFLCVSKDDFGIGN